MTGGEITFLSMVVAAFLVFVIALSWISEVEQRKQRRRSPPSSTGDLPLRKAA